MRMNRWALAGLLLFLLVSSLLHGGEATKPLTPAERLAPQALARSIELAAGYLERHCEPNGRFVYRRDLEDKIDYGAKYNLVRHAGAMYALGSYYQRTPNDKTKATLIRAGKYLRTFIEPIDKKDRKGKEKNILAVITYPKRLGSGKNSTELIVAKLGGSALGLIGLLQQAQAAPETVPRSRLRGLGNFLLYAQRDSGEFHSKYFPGKGLSNSFTSLYYPGEAILALVYLSEIDDDPRWLRGAVKGMTYLDSIRKHPQTIPPDHWALIATKKLLKRMVGKGFPESATIAIRRHAKMVTELILSEQVFMPRDPLTNGVFVMNPRLRDARTCPTATRLEGLLAIQFTIPRREGKMHRRIRRSIDAGLVFLLQTQVTSGALAGGIPRGACPLNHVRNRHDLKYMERRNEVRIDYVQHALSAMMDYEAMIKLPAQQAPPVGGSKPKL